MESLSKFTVFVSNKKQTTSASSYKKRVQLSPQFPIGAMVKMSIMYFSADADIGTHDFVQLRFSDGISVDSIVGGDGVRSDCVQLPDMWGMYPLPLNVTTGRITQPSFSVEVLGSGEQPGSINCDYYMYLLFEVIKDKAYGTTQMLS